MQQPRIKRKRTTRSFKSHGFTVSIGHSLYSKKPSDVAKTTSREDIPQTLWDLWSFSQQQIYYNARKAFLHSEKITEEVLSVFRCNKKLAQYA